MPPTSVLCESSFPDLVLHRRGKVRDVYEVRDHLLIVATDRISAFDFVLGSAIPDKGRVLTMLSAFWFEFLADVVANHMLSVEPETFPAETHPYADQLAGRAMLVRRTTPIPVECVARGYLAGSGWQEYVRSGCVCGIDLPPGLRESDRLPEPIFTPATKADTGHDLNITLEQAGELVGHELMARLRDLTLTLYQAGARHAESRGLIVADTKFEFGVIPGPQGDTVMLIDEALTPDSSRFWPADQYDPGRPQPSFDKQYVRDYLESIRWNKQPPVPALPDQVVEQTRQKYLDAFQRITGRALGMTRGTHAG